MRRFAFLLAAVLVVPFTAATAASVPQATAATEAPAGSRQVLMNYAATTWASFVAMTHPTSGLPADTLHINGSRSVQTSTTNIGGYLWSAVVAYELRLIDRSELVNRVKKTIATLERMERHRPSGQYYNWYDHRTGAKLTRWPPTGEPLTPILSSVDNGWLATGLRIVRSTVPEVAARADALYDSMDFGFYYQPDVNRILFHYAPDTGEAPCCYDTIVSESRIASYIGIANGQIPQRHYFGQWRTFPNSCDWSWQETKPVGYDRTLFGETVFEGAYPYYGTRVVPGWGGSAFEALMPTLFVPEERWAPGSWRINHPLTVRSQIHHGLQVARYGYWGFSPANIPEGGYSEYGVDAVGMNPEGYASNTDKTYVDPGFAGCPGREPKPVPPPSAFTNGVVTPHAVFLSLRWEQQAALANLAKLRRDFNIYSKWGFRDTVNVDTGVVSEYYLSLDQAMIMGAIGNLLGRDILRRAFVAPDLEKRIRPVMAVEEFNASPRHCTITGTPGNDVLYGTPRDDVICGLGGHDVIYANNGHDALFGDEGDDKLYGLIGNDTSYGGPGNDIIADGYGVDILSGGPGNDRLDGGYGRDHHEGGEGTDTCVAARGDTSTGCERR